MTTTLTCEPFARDGQIPKIASDNNFDLIRLLAAFQVMVVHLYNWLHLEGQVRWFDRFMEVFIRFPGVPVFFVISGFLIARSWDSNREDWKRYARSRLFRIYPALIVCFLFTVFAIGVSNHQVFRHLLSPQGFLWSVGQLTFVQFWTPDCLRAWGFGTPNGSLWSIPVEMQFYVIVPLFAMLMTGKDYRTKIALIGILFAVSLGADLFNLYVLKLGTMPYKMLRNTFIPNIWQFAMGALLYANFDQIKGFIIGKHWHWAAAVTASAMLWMPGNYVTHLFHYMVMAPLVLALAFAKPVSNRLLNGNDLSYGMYIYHMPVLNMLFSFGRTGYGAAAFGAVGCVVMAAVSWFCIERPVLHAVRRKPTALAPVTSSST